MITVTQEQLNMLSRKYMDSCPICKGRRMLDSGHQCECVQKFDEAVRQIQANIPENFKNITLELVDEDFKRSNSNSLGKLLTYRNKLPEALQTGFSLYIHGPEGSGKSFLGVSILKQAIKGKFSAYFMLSEELVGVAYEALTNDSLRTRMHQMMRSTDFLLIDEIDGMYLNRDESPLITLLHGFFKIRFYANKPIIFTASKQKNDLDKSLHRFVSIYGEKLTSIEIKANHKSKLRNSRTKEFFNGN